MLNNEKVITGKQAIEVLAKFADKKDIILSAQLYDGNDDGIAEEISKFDKQNIVTSKKNYPISVLNNPDFELIIIEPSDEILKILKEIKSPYERLLEDVNERITNYGLPINALSMELENKKEILNILDLKKTPSKNEISTFFELIKNLENLHWCLKFFIEWQIALEQKESMFAEGRMYLTFLFRKCSLFEKAIKTSNVVEFGKNRFQCSPNLLSTICTIRAAAFLDIFEHHNDRELLKITRLTLNKAWANKKSEEASLVYKRLDKIERVINTQDYKIKVNDAYKKWADWTR